MNLIELIEATILIFGVFVDGSGCKPPLESFYGSSTSLDGNETDIQEVLFMGASSPFDDERKICKMKCLDGKWVGPICSQHTEQQSFITANHACRIDPLDENLVLSYNGKIIKISPSKFGKFTHGSVIKMRCSETGKMKMVGEASSKCENGVWVSELPTCVQTNVLTGFKGDTYPPGIEWSIPSGAGVVDSDGSLVLLPRTILHLNCLFPRFHGTPEWHWSANYRKYPTGWALPMMERDSQYRLSIYYAEERDSGMFSCITPKGYTNGVAISVRDITCPDIRSEDGLLLIEGQGLTLGSWRNFSCPLGYILAGSRSVKCLPSGEWSDTLPECQVIQCQRPFIEDPRLKVLSMDLFYSGKAVFECPLNFLMLGNSSITCLVNGSWSGHAPTCQDIICSDVEPPLHGRVQVIGNRHVGSTALFSCFTKYILRGSAVTHCTLKGNWSTNFPSCETSCEHPGRPMNGRLIPRRPRYEIGFIALVSCNPGFRPAGPDRLKCLETSLWSSPLTPCVSYFRSELKKN